MKYNFLAHASMYLVAHAVILWCTVFCGVCSPGAPQKYTISVAHGPRCASESPHFVAHGHMRHRNHILVASFLWRTHLCATERQNGCATDEQFPSSESKKLKVKITRVVSQEFFLYSYKDRLKILMMLS